VERNELYSLLKMLKSHSWRISYSSNENNPIADFYIPALESAIQYDRKSGYFSGAILSRVARGIGAMLHHQGKMRLIMGCQFSPQDLAAIQQGYELKAVLADRLNTHLPPPANFVQLQHFEILSWLVANDCLDIRIAVPCKPDGIPEIGNQVLDSQHIFHEKVGIFTDINGDRIAFSGSNNESLAGWENNVESFHVYCDWEDQREFDRVQAEADRFEQLWQNQSPNVRIFDLPTAVKNNLLQYQPASRPSWHQQQELTAETSSIDPTPLQPIPLDKQLLEQLRQIHNHPGCLDFCLKSIPIQPWPHQIKILKRVAANFPCNFLIADEVGLGKTIETGLILRYLLISQKVKRVLLLVPASVQTQWQKELKEKFNLYFWSYSQGEFQDYYGQTATPLNNPWNTQNLVLASSHLVRRGDRMAELLDAEPWDLVILDEAHHARRQSPQQRKDTPNRLLQLMRQLKAKTQSMILLSATPMQIDPIEVFDLLQLLGLQGHWDYGDNLCDYFSSLANDFTSQSIDFCQLMSTGYFQHGGQPCPRLNEFHRKTDRLLTYELQDIWQKGKSISNIKQFVHNTPLVNASRQYLTINTPLKDLMFRHTRDTLRQYYRQGLLDRDIPTRDVQDGAIVLAAGRENALYVAVSDYVRHFYRLAQKENRKALGFLMTLYRKRLTSSFYAIQQSLQRRLAGISITLDPEDYSDLDDADEVVITGLESYLQEPVSPKEIEYLEDLLRQFENTGEDSKLSHFIAILHQELNQRASVIVFTQYTDTMDYIRDALSHLYNSQVACYSGRGGEIYQDQKWERLSKDKIITQFQNGTIKILLCTESASEGLNLQTCGVLINYDLPWNPMRVEQRIGRIDRIGQIHPTVKIHNFCYDGTVEAKVYGKLRERINAFQTVIGNLQPILAQVPTFIEKAVMSADPEEEGVLLAEFDEVLNAPLMRPALDEMVAMDVEADLAEISKPTPPTLITIAQIEQLLTNPDFLQNSQFKLEPLGNQIWRLNDGKKTYEVTFYTEKLSENSKLRLMSFGEPLFNQVLNN
jgi:SNF2 family DNA or RNA helicase